MRQALFRWHFTALIVLLAAVLSGVSVRNGNGNFISGMGLSVTKAATSDKVSGLFDYAQPLSDNPDIAFRANLVPAPNNGLVNPRQNPPVWERISAARPLKVISGLCFAIMLIALFFIFYRNSRNCSEGDDDISGFNNCKSRLFI